MRRALVALLSCSSLLLAGLLLAGSWLAGSALAQDIGAAREAVCCGPACCLIDGVCASGNPDSPSHANPRNPCEVCDPEMSQSEWTAVPGCVAPDAGPAAQPDAGTPPTPPPPSGGCSAAGAGGAGASLLLGVVGLALLWRRRR